MITKKVVLPSIAATSLMTLCSYVIAEQEKKNFSEPKLLAKIERRQLDVPKQMQLPAGWATHYGVGIIIATLFELYKNYFGAKPAFRHSIIFGISAGLLSIAAWQQLLKMLPQKQRSFYRKFYTQLFFAHLIFAGALTSTQKVMKRY
ncbi:MAG: hypothetical protein JO072_10755 [Parafilimonas sp.]|nr:hypothetical protein [Parafilimonas sp.]